MGKHLTRYFLCLQTARRHPCHLVTWYTSPGHVWGHRGCVSSVPRWPLVPEQDGPDSISQMKE